MTPARRVADRATRSDRITTRFLSMPHDAATGGRTVAAGSVMEWIDQAGYACAVGWSGSYCVTAYVGNVRHDRPIAPGSLVAVTARIVHTGRSSMTVAATVASADVREQVYLANTTCILVFVAVGDDRTPVPVPQWHPRSEADREIAAAASSRIDVRRQIKASMLSQEYSAASAAPRSVLRFVVPPSSVNFGGAAHGGTVMRWIDEAGYACAVPWSSENAVAVYSGGIHFLAPVRIGDLIELDARLIYTAPKSMHIAVRVFTADPRTPDARTMTTVCMLIYEDLDGERSSPVRRWEPLLPEDVRLAEHAVELIHRRSELIPIPADLALRD